MHTGPYKIVIPYKIDTGSKGNIMMACIQETV